MADDDTAALLDVIGHAADILGVVLPGVSLVGDVVKWFLQEPAAPDPIIASLAKVDAALGALQDEVLATWVTARRDSLSLLTANSTAALQTAFEFVQSGKDASSPEWADSIALAQRDSLVAVQTFVSSLDTGYWRRPYSIKAISQDGDPTSDYYGWMIYMPDRAEKDSFDTVWDYRWGLPATVYAITARLVVLRLTGWSAEATLGEVRQYNTFIASVYQRMDGGIRCLEPPSSPGEDIVHPTIPVAVADIYGGYYTGGLFDTLLTPQDLGNRPYPPSGIVPYSRDWPTVVKNAKLITKYWRDSVATTIGLPNLLWFAGRLENALHPPLPAPNSLFLFHSGDGELVSGQPWTGVFYRVSPNGDLYWYKYEGAGERDPSGNTGWNANSGNPIGNGWANFKFVLGAGNGIILTVETNGDMRWHRYVGQGESNVLGNTGWDANSGNQIGRGWNSFSQIIVKPVSSATPMVIYGVLDGDLVWHSYVGQGESDPTGSNGWDNESGNRIGPGWQLMRLFYSNDIFGISLDGELRWYRYQGGGNSDPSGNTGWTDGSGTVIATNWSGYRNVFGAGNIIFTVDGSGGLHWFNYQFGPAGWAENSGNSIGNGW